VSYPPQGVVAGDMFKSVYDSDVDGKIALAQLENAVCSETELANAIAAHILEASAHHTKSPEDTVIEERRLNDDIRHSNNTNRVRISTSYGKVKEVLMNEAVDMCRIHFEMKKAVTGNVSGWIYKNGVPLGIERNTSNTNYQSYDEDFDPADFAPNDLIQIYSKGSTVTTEVHIANMRFCYRVFREITHVAGNQLKTVLGCTPLSDPVYSMTNQDP